MRPSYRRPYYYINNLNTQTYNPTNPMKESNGSSIGFTGTDSPISGEVQPNYKINKPELQDQNTNLSINRSIKIKIPTEEATDSTVVKTAGHRYGNSSNVRLEIRYGQDSSVFQLIGVMIDYIKAPQFIRLTQEQLDLTEDTSQILEFPDYICQEIINELVKLIMENASDPRMQTQSAVSMSIAAPAQAQTTQNSKK